MQIKFARPGSKPSYGPDQQFDTQHIFLDLVLHVEKKTLEGKCAITLKALFDSSRTLYFDAVQMKILSVRSENGESLSTQYDGKKLTVHLAHPLKEQETVTVIIAYRVTDPIAGIHFVRPDKFYPDRPVQVWTHGEAEESRYWFPCLDAPHDKATTELRVTVPQDFFALSNGSLLSALENAKTKTKIFHWRQTIPHSPYLVTLVAGRFSEIQEEWEGIPVLYYCQPGREKETKRAFGKTPKMLQFFSDKIGLKYPYEKYAQIAVAEFIMGGMEHTTATTQTDRVLMDEKAYPEITADWLVSHELAHQWFGDLLTCKEWSHAWLNESFATYFEALFAEHDLGKDEFDYEMEDKLKLYLDEDKKVYRRAIVTNIYRKPDDLFDRHLYEKGSLVLHMLRRQLGEDLFWKSIRLYVENFQEKAVETSDLINSIQQATGRNMRRFFDQFVFAAGHPEYTVHYAWSPSQKTALLIISQKGEEKGPLFSVPVEIEFHTSKGTRKFVKQIEEKRTEFRFRLPEEPLDFRFDPNHSILKTAEIHKPHAMWRHQLLNDPHVVGRIQAAKEVAKIRTESSLQSLLRAFRKEKFWGSAKEIAVALGSTEMEEAKTFLIQILPQTKNPKIRRGVVEALGKFKDKSAQQALENALFKDASYFVRSQAIQSLVKIRPQTVTSLIQKALRMPSWNDTIQSSA
ncbi:MAG: HEAT repeat domain-containing protein, partial [Elusimicrobia bacterium]|nr:HEAT repeat domain-containing protein [Elusimicrobiota bacterium]